MKSFCDRFGLPGGGRPDLRGGRPQFVLVDELLRHQRQIRRALSLLQEGDSSALIKYWNSSEGTALIRTELRAGGDGRLEMVFAPPDLIQAMWLQLAQFACSGTKLLRCERCNEPFVVGSGTGRRSTSKYCSNACKVAAFKERHAQAEEESK